MNGIDGVDHINVYSNGATPLGRFLSNFALVRVDTEDGLFYSIEGYWYWLGTAHSDKDVLRRLWGAQAKAVGRKLCKEAPRVEPDFEGKIKRAITVKLKSDPLMWTAFRDSRKPLAHYYVYKGKRVEANQAHNWVIEFLGELRKTP